MEKEPTVSIEIELDDFTRADLENLIIRSHEMNMTINEYIVYSLEQYIKNNPVDTQEQILSGGE